MPALSPTKRIQRKAQEIINKEFVPRLIDKLIEYHTQGGQYPGCDCSYCNVKRWATAYVGTTNMRSVGRFYYLLHDNGDSFIEREFLESLLIQEEDQIKDLIEQHREFKRKEIRDRLLMERKRVL